MGLKAKSFTLTQNEKDKVEKNINLIYSFANTFGVDVEEYWEPLSIGLIKAVHSYEKSDKQHKLSSYVYTQMKSEVLNFRKKQITGNRVPPDKKVYYQSDYEETYENLLIDHCCVEKEVTSKLFIHYLFTLLTPLEKLVAQKMYEGYSLTEIQKINPHITYRAVNIAHKHIQRIFLHNYSQTERLIT